MRAFATCLLFILCGVLYAYPATIVRHSIIGTTHDGSIAAFTRSYYGPSSRVLFAELIIKKAGETKPLYKDGASLWQGEEKELKQLIASLIEKNLSTLNDYKITRQNPPVSEATMMVTDNTNPEIISGYIDLERGPYVDAQEFIIKSKLTTCPRNPQAIELEFIFNGVSELVVKPDEDTCWDDSFSLRTIYKTPKALWFVITTHAYAIGELEVYPVEFEGILIK